jgi:carbon monoxide dehydrogenase subunit G
MTSDLETAKVTNRFDNSFEVPLPPAEAWPILTNIGRIAPFMPGVELTEVVDERTYRGRISVRLGPTALVFSGVVTLEELDPVGHKARVKAQGNDAKEGGGANATASFRIEPAGNASKVLVRTDLVLSGAVAQYSLGMIQATATEVITQFAANLRGQIPRHRAA